MIPKFSEGVIFLKMLQIIFKIPYSIQMKDTNLPRFMHSNLKMHEFS